LRASIYIFWEISF